MIGDSPGLSIATRNGQLYTKVPLLEPGTITLPIGPNHSIGPGKGEDKRIDLDESHVARLNARQESEAVVWVLCHPDSGLKSFVDAVRPAAW